MSADILDRLDFMLISRRSDEDAIIRDARAEIVRLRGEVAVANECLGEERAANVLRTPAPAMPNGVEGLLSQARAVLERFRAQDDDAATVINRIDALRAADNRDAAGVCNCASGRGSEHCVVHTSNDVLHHMNRMDATPAAVPAGEAVAYSVVQIGNRGAAYDPPNTHRAFTYEHQPGNIDASRLGRATAAAAVASAGDGIDRGLSLLKELQALGFGVFQIGPPAPVQAAPQDGEAVAWIRDNLPESLHGMGVVDVLQLLLDGGIAAEKDLIDAESPHPADGGAVDFWVCPDCTHYYMTDGVICDCHGRAGQQRMRHVRMVPMVTTPPAAQVQAAPQEGSDHG